MILQLLLFQFENKLQMYQIKFSVELILKKKRKNDT